MRGSESRSFDAINDAIESVGASLGIGSGRHAVSVGGKSLVEDFYPVLLDVLADVLQHPTFPPEHVERVRGQRLTALQERDNDTRSMASLLFRKLAYPETHPYREPIDGWRHTISALRREDLVDFYRRTYGPAGGVLVIVGAVDATRTVEEVRRVLGAWASVQHQPFKSSPVDLLPALPPYEHEAREEVFLSGKTQSDIVLGVPGLRRADPDYYAARLADTVLGRFGMMGRLGDNVRERLGLAYYAYSVLQASKGPGPWMVVAGVNPANIERCLAAVDEELARLGADLVPEEELNDSKAYLTGSLPLQLETNEGVAQAILDMAWYDLGLDYLRRYRDLIMSVTAEQVRGVASRYLKPGVYALAIAGPARNLAQPDPTSLKGDAS